MTFIFDYGLEQMTLAKYNKDQTCSDWRDIENLSFCCFDLDLWPWYLTLTWILWWLTSIPTIRPVCRSLGLKVLSWKQIFLVFYHHDLVRSIGQLVQKSSVWLSMVFLTTDLNRFSWIIYQMKEEKETFHSCTPRTAPESGRPNG